MKAIGELFELIIGKLLPAAAPVAAIEFFDGDVNFLGQINTVQVYTVAIGV